MRRIGCASLFACLISGAPGDARERPVTVHLGTPVSLVTVEALTSKTSAKGDMIALRTSQDIVVDGVVVIPNGTGATGQVSESRGTGGMGTTGKLIVRPLYLRLGDRVVRLTGRTASQGATKADTIVGMVLLTPLLSGRSARVPAGTALPAMVEKSVVLNVSVPD